MQNGRYNLATIPASRRKNSGPQRIRIGLKGVVTDVAPELLEAHALDSMNVGVSPDGSYLVAPMGGRTLTHHVVPQGSTRALDEYYTTIYRCDSTPFGRPDGMILAALDSADEVVDLCYFKPEEVWVSLVPLPDLQGPQISVQIPTVNQELRTKDTVTITWTESGDTPPGATNVFIYLMDSDDDVAVDITNGTATANDGSYSWAIPKTDDAAAQLNGEYYIKIEGEKNEFYYALSGVFTIRPAQIIVHGPGASPAYEIVEGSDLWITWESLGEGIAATVKIELRETTPDQLIATIAAAQANAEGINYVSYTIPVLGTYDSETDYYVLVEDTTDSDITDNSAQFTIHDAGATVDPALILTKPDTAIITYDGDQLSGLYMLAATVNITWSTQGDVGDYVEIIAFKVNGTKEVNLGQVLATQGYYNWVLPAETAADADEYPGKWKITLRSVEGLADDDTSEYPFLIQRQVDLEEFEYKAPLGGTFEEGQDVTIERGKADGTGNVKIDLTTNPTGQSAYIISSSQALSNGKYVWTVPEVYIYGTTWPPVHRHPEVGQPYYIVITRLITGRPTVFGGPVMFRKPQTGNEAFFPVWSREDAAHEIYKATMHEGANNTPYKAVTWAQTAGIEDASGYVAANGGTSMPTVRQMITDRDGNLLVGWMDADDSGVRRPQQTTGSGLNDLQSRGNTAYSGTKPKTYTITITTAAGTDKFDWSDGDGGSGTAVTITGGWQALNNNVEVMFAATTGHTLNDVFTVYAINGFPLTRVGDTCRLKKYDRIGHDEIWAADCAAAVRTLEVAADEVHIYEHMAIATNESRQVLVAMAGYTLTGATYARRLWVQRIDSDGTIDETVGYNTFDAAGTPTDPTHMGLCAVYGACWAPSGDYWVVYDHKTAEDGTAAYQPTEFTGKIRRVADDDLTDTSVFTPTPEGAAWAMFLGISYQEGGQLVMPAFWRYDPTGVDERRVGILVMTTNGYVRWCAGKGYNTSGAQRKAYPHPGGGCGFERNGPEIGTFMAGNQASTEPGAANKTDLYWLTAGDYMWLFDADLFRTKARNTDAGGTVGQGTVHTFNCHALTRTAGGDIAYLAYEYQDATFANKDLLVRLSIAEPTTGAPRCQIIHEQDSSNNTNTPMLPQPWLWFGGPDANGYNTELDHDAMPWALLAINAGKRPEGET